MILFKKEVKESQLDIKNDIMVTQRYIVLKNGVENENDIGNSNELLINTVYKCEVIVTNVSP
jgi:hypothetical protein